MRTREETDRLRDQAVELRRAGKSIQEIRAILGPIGKEFLQDALRGVPPPEWTFRPNAKDDLREQARELRRQGRSFNEIVDALKVSKSSVSLWVRDLPRPPRKPLSEEAEARLARGRASRSAALTATTTAARAQIGALDDRELLIAGAMAYWCEGSKNKPGHQNDRVAFTNSDPGLISLFLRFLASVGVPPETLIFRLYIHEDADIDGAQAFWRQLTGAPPEQFRSPFLKQQNPSTVRKNRGDGFRGCLRIDVRQSRDVYRRIEGWANAILKEV